MAEPIDVNRITNQASEAASIGEKIKVYVYYKVSVWGTLKLMLWILAAD